MPNEEISEHVRAQVLVVYPILEYFVYKHLPPHLQIASKSFSDLAWSMAFVAVDESAALIPYASCVRFHQELAEGLRKLLEGKDCYVRACMKLRSKP